MESRIAQLSGEVAGVSQNAERLDPRLLCIPPANSATRPTFSTVPSPLPEAPTQQPETEPRPVPAVPERQPNLDPFNPSWPDGRPEPEPKA
jgi:hypothetical protein